MTGAFLLSNQRAALGRGATGRVGNSEEGENRPQDDC